MIVFHLNTYTHRLTDSQTHSLSYTESEYISMNSFDCENVCTASPSPLGRLFEIVMTTPTVSLSLSSLDLLLTRRDDISKIRRVYTQGQSLHLTQPVENITFRQYSQAIEPLEWPGTKR